MTKEEIIQSKVGIRFDQGKVKMNLLDPRFLDMLGQIMTENTDIRLDLIPKCLLVELGKVYYYGAVKYSDRNWEKGIAFNRVIGPIYRHFIKWLRGEKKDPELGTHHLAQVIWNCAALMEFEITHPECDDRNIQTMDLGNGK